MIHIFNAPRAGSYHLPGVQLRDLLSGPTPWQLNLNHETILENPQKACLLGSNSFHALSHIEYRNILSHSVEVVLIWRDAVMSGS
jgi:hypothetical protein